ncbi:beta-N-acetylhexosaminidase [Pedobacter yulinensis]|uniref:beta-N-acetylhexosaminidase n=1 Tax=Pedobacter yulinensis TaxID=2126353 RepID=A0A2T3HH47_9SPHI|nr:beta-N-acetylhexosaminidase [Pedobacter yulinensis]PST81723.1 beta-N-acetylhexosaminidase [Pedobacter yulinensis]
MKSLLYILLFLCGGQILPTAAQRVNIIPMPQQLTEKKDPGSDFILDSSTVIAVSDSALLPAARFLQAYLQNYYALNLPVRQGTTLRNQKPVSLTLTGTGTGQQDMHQIDVQAKGISLSSATAAGVFHGIQTLIQLVPPVKEHELRIPGVAISDYPRFAYRGMHLDVSRHFFDVQFIKKYIDYLAMHKMNFFHWHLTDDHGWRIQIKKYPELTEVGAWRNGTIIGLYPGTGNDGKRYGGYYTQDEIREVVRYAGERYITVIPEIEMPGHSMAVLAAYPELSTTPNLPKEVAQTWGIFNKFNNVLLPSAATFHFLEDVLTEVMDLFPSTYIHIGGDECSKIWWKQSAFCQNLIREKGLKDMNGLQSYFIRRVEKFVNSKGRTIIGWDEILDGGLAPNAVVMSWRGETGGVLAAKQGHQVIMTPEKFMYFNHSQFLKEDSLTAARYLPIEDVYRYEPIPDVLPASQHKYVWGAQANLWSEYVAGPEKAEYMLFPRLDALSEVLWSSRSARNYPDFRRRLQQQLQRYKLMGITFSPRYLDME